jgi:hypothetical protein
MDFPEEIASIRPYGHGVGLCFGNALTPRIRRRMEQHPMIYYRMYIGSWSYAMTSGLFAPDHFLDFLVEKATPQEILAYKVPDSVNARTIELLERRDEGNLTASEAEELEQIRQMDLMLQALYARALRALRTGT